MPRLFLIFFLIHSVSVAAPLSTSTAKTMRVAALVEPPFISYDRTHNLTGPAIDIFEQAALDNRWAYKLYPVEGDVDHQIKALAEGQYDILIGSIATTLSRIEQVSFSRPFYLDQGKLAIHRQSVSPLNVLFDVVQSIPLKFVACIFFLLLFVAHIMWFAERNKNKEMPAHYIAGIIFSSWFFVAHFFKGGLLYHPQSNTARSILVLWLIFALSIFLLATSTYTAYITARLVETKRSIDDTRALRGVKIAYVNGQNYTLFPGQVGAIGVSVNSAAQALSLVQNKAVFGAVAGQTIMAADLEKMNLPDVIVSTMDLSKEEYAFALPLNSPYLRPLNLAIVKLQDSGQMATICKTYLGERYFNCEF